MMVDSSIVVLENIFRRSCENSETPSVASVTGAQEVGKAIVASTITTLVIFLPLVFVRGVTGILFKELAYVIIFSLICSLAVSLTLVPMLASRLLKSTLTLQERRKTWVEGLMNFSNAFFLGLDNAYLRLLKTVLRHRLVTIFLAVAPAGGKPPAVAVHRERIHPPPATRVKSRSAER